MSDKFIGEIGVRSTSLEDLPQILSILIDGGLSEWSKDDLASEIHRNNAICLSAVSSESGMVGFIMGRIIPGNENDEWFDAEIYNLGVLRKFRNCGIGSSLIRNFITICYERKVKIMWLEVRSSNRTAIRFYEGHGFSNVATRKAFYRDPMEDANVMSATIYKSTKQIT